MSFDEWFAKEFAGQSFINYRDDPTIRDVARRAWVASGERCAQVAAACCASLDPVEVADAIRKQP